MTFNKNGLNTTLFKVLRGVKGDGKSPQKYKKRTFEKMGKGQGLQGLQHLLKNRARIKFDKKSLKSGWKNGKNCIIMLK